MLVPRAALLLEYLTNITTTVAMTKQPRKFENIKARYGTVGLSQRPRQYGYAHVIHHPHKVNFEKDPTPEVGAKPVCGASGYDTKK